MEYKLFHNDNNEIFEQFENLQFDVSVTDPPYGLNESGKANISRSVLAKGKDYGNVFDDSKPASQEQINQIIRVSKNQVIFGGNYFVLPPSPSWIVWDKVNGKNDFADCELAWTSYNKAVRKFTYMWHGMIRQDKSEQRFHPTQKPLALMKWVIENYTQPEDTVFDPFMGSGTTGVACMLLGRNFYGIEKEKAFFDIAEKRIYEASLSIPLFAVVNKKSKSKDNQSVLF